VFVGFQWQAVHHYGNMLKEKERVLKTTSRDRVKAVCRAINVTESIAVNI